MSQGGPSMTALLGLLAVAGYQNRDKIAEWMGGGAHAAPAGSGGSVPNAGSRPAGLDRFLPQHGGGDLGTMLQKGLSELVGSFTQAGHADTAHSWVNHGENKPIAPPDVEKAVGSTTIDDLAKQTGLSRQEILARLSRELPNAVDKYTPDGRLPSAA